MLRGLPGLWTVTRQASGFALRKTLGLPSKSYLANQVGLRLIVSLQTPSISVAVDSGFEEKLRNFEGIDEALSSLHKVSQIALCGSAEILETA